MRDLSPKLLSTPESSVFHRLLDSLFKVNLRFSYQNADGDLLKGDEHELTSRIYNYLEIFANEVENRRLNAQEGSRKNDDDEYCLRTVLYWIDIHLQLVYFYEKQTVFMPEEHISQRMAILCKAEIVLADLGRNLWSDQLRFDRTCSTLYKFLDFYGGQEYIGSDFYLMQVLRMQLDRDDIVDSFGNLLDFLDQFVQVSTMKSGATFRYGDHELESSTLHIIFITIVDFIVELTDYIEEIGATDIKFSRADFVKSMERINEIVNSLEPAFFGTHIGIYVFDSLTEIYLAEPILPLSTQYEASPSDSVLWLKLRTKSSPSDLHLPGKTTCVICMEDNANADFAILDNCAHVFCVHCISTWFETSSRCPECRSVTDSWTSLYRFLECYSNLTNHEEENEINEEK